MRFVFVSYKRHSMFGKGFNVGESIEEDLKVSETRLNVLNDGMVSFNFRQQKYRQQKR